MFLKELKGKRFSRISDYPYLCLIKRLYVKRVKKNA